MTRVLGLDMATKCGWAVHCGESGVKNLKPGTTQRPGARYQRLRNLLNLIKQKYPDITVVAFEQVIPFHKSGEAAEYARGCVAIVQMWCADANLPIRPVFPSTAKKFVTGKGNAKKHEVIAAVSALGFSPEDDNHADAIAIMLWASQ